MNPPNDQKSLRDEFAMAALTGLLTIKETYVIAGSKPDGDVWVAESAYDLADAMLLQRKK